MPTRHGSQRSARRCPHPDQRRGPAAPCGAPGRTGCSGWRGRPTSTGPRSAPTQPAPARASARGRTVTGGGRDHPGTQTCDEHDRQQEGSGAVVGDNLARRRSTAQPSQPAQTTHPGEGELGEDHSTQRGHLPTPTGQHREAAQTEVAGTASRTSKACHHTRTTAAQLRLSTWFIDQNATQCATVASSGTARYRDQGRSTAGAHRDVGRMPRNTTAYPRNGVAASAPAATRGRSGTAAATSEKDRREHCGHSYGDDAGPRGAEVLTRDDAAAQCQEAEQKLDSPVKPSRGTKIRASQWVGPEASLTCQQEAGAGQRHGEGEHGRPARGTAAARYEQGGQPVRPVRTSSVSRTHKAAKDDDVERHGDQQPHHRKGRPEGRVGEWSRT